MYSVFTILLLDTATHHSLKSTEKGCQNVEKAHVRQLPQTTEMIRIEAKRMELFHTLTFAPLKQSLNALVWEMEQFLSSVPLALVSDGM